VRLFPGEKDKKAPGYSLNVPVSPGTRSTLWDIRSDEPLQLVGPEGEMQSNEVRPVDEFLGFEEAGPFFPGFLPGEDITV